MKFEHAGEEMTMVVILDGEPVGYMGTKEAAEYIGIKQDTIRKWIAGGKLQTLKIGKEHWIKGDVAYQIRKERDSWIL